MSFHLRAELTSQAEFYNGLMLKRASADVTIPAYSDVRKTIKLIADSFFSKDFTASWGGFQEVKVDVAEFTVIDGEVSQELLNDSVKKVASICHSRVSKASDVGKDLSDAEKAVVNEAFKELAKTFSASKKFDEETIKVLASSECTEVVIKCSEAFVRSLNNFSARSLINHFEGKVGNTNFKNALIQLAPRLFPDSLCTKSKIKEIQDSKVGEPIIYNNLTVDGCFEEFSKSLLKYGLLIKSLEQLAESDKDFVLPPEAPKIVEAQASETSVEVLKETVSKETEMKTLKTNVEALYNRFIQLCDEKKAKESGGQSSSSKASSSESYTLSQIENFKKRINQLNMNTSGLAEVAVKFATFAEARAENRAEPVKSSGFWSWLGY